MTKKILKELLLNRNFTQLKKELTSMNPVDIAELLIELETDEQLLVFRLLKKDEAADAFSEMNGDEQRDLINGFTDQELTVILEEMDEDDLADVVEEMPAGVVERVLAKTSPEMRNAVNHLLQYKEDSAGAIMTTEFIALKETMSVKEAFEYIRAVADEREDVYTCYITSEARILEGVVTVKEMLMSGLEETIGTLMNRNVIHVNTGADREEAARLFDKYNFTALPVVDNENRLVGMITVDDAIDTMREEISEDFEKMAALNPKEEDYFHTSIMEHVRNRLPWLLILMFSSIATGLVIEKYEVAFQAMPALVALMPMLSDTGGNAGSQTSTLIIRGMALGEIRLSDFLKVFFKEFRIALICGLVLGISNGLRIYIQYHSLVLALIIAITLLLTVIAAKLCGAVMPMLAKKLGLDPAIMASPLLTTVVDVCSVFIYFNIATILMGL